MKPKRGKHILRKTRMMRSVIALAVLAAVLSATFAIQGTLAWLNHSDSINNQMGIMQYIFSQTIEEDFTPPGPGVKFLGGESIEKKSWVTNNGDIPVFVRVKVFPVLIAPDGPLHFEAQFGKQLHFVDLGADWMDGGDGYYYYLGLVPPGGSTEPLFEQIELDEDIVTYADAELTVTLIAETVETRKYDGGTKYHYRDAWWDNAVGIGDRTAVAAALDPLATG